MVLTCSATNGAGLSASYPLTIKVDQTPPTIAGSRAPVANAAGWNNATVTVTFVCTDNLSGVYLLSPTSITLSSAGTSQMAGSTCQDLAGNTASQVVAGINIDKMPPVTTSLAANPNPVVINASITVSASLSDSGGSGLSGADYSVNGCVPTLLSPASGASAQVAATVPPFTMAGVYQLCVHGRDVAGNVGTDECFFLPVYDPSGGFVTGGGWINSPAGAYALNPSLTGKATFGFVSKYQPGANSPGGDTQFQFRVADLNFRSSSYQWLVVAGARAQYKGSGTINQTGSYQFLLTAIDGDLPGGGGIDRFRIKIWSGGGIVYDNQMGADDNGDPTTALGGGSIVIHK